MLFYHTLQMQYAQGKKTKLPENKDFSKNRAKFCRIKQRLQLILYVLISIFVKYDRVLPTLFVKETSG